MKQQLNSNTASNIIQDNRKLPDFQIDLKRQIILGKIESLKHELEELEREYKFKVILQI